MDEFLHEYCRELQHTPAFLADPQAAEAAVRARLLADYGSNGQFVLPRAKGCPACEGSGYKGRLGLHELMLGSDALKNASRNMPGSPNCSPRRWPMACSP